jgi:hypothetical protein
MGPPMPGAVETMTELYEDGHELIIFTNRGTEVGKQHVIEWLKYFHIPFGEVTNIKGNWDIFIDDKCIPFHDWTQVKDALDAWEDKMRENISV